MAELETAVSFYLAVIDPENDDENCVARIEARDKAVALRARELVIVELERIAANARWADDRNMLTGICKLLRDKYNEPARRWHESDDLE